MQLQSFLLLKTRMRKRISPHGDLDHLGETINLVNDFNVLNVIFNCGNFANLENELITLLDKKHIKKDVLKVGHHGSKS